MAGHSGRRGRWAAVGAGTLGATLMVAAASLATAQVAGAEPVPPVEPPPPPLELIEPAGSPAAATDAAPVSASLAPADAAGSPPAAVEGVSHLPSPDSLPPGTTQTPQDSGRLGYLRDLWHAVRTQDVTMTDAFLLFAQRPMDDKAIAGMSPQPHNPAAPLPDAALPDQAAAPAAPPVQEAEGAEPAPVLPVLPGAAESPAPDPAA